MGLKFYLVEYEEYNPPYFFKVLKDYSKIFSLGYSSSWGKKEDIYSLYDIYKENYRGMKRRFIREMLKTMTIE